MRLIDADLLEDKVDVADANENGIHEILEYVRYSHIEDAPTVEAIPVEWLLNHIPNDEQMERYNKKLIEYLVIGWREANERRKREM